MSRIAKLLALSALLLLAALAAWAGPFPGDQDGDTDVDVDDILIILAAIGSPAGAGDPRDLDGDGVITALDAGKAVLLCTRPLCVTGNNAPEITTAAAFSAPENQTAAGDVDATDPDGDAEGSGLVYSLTGGADQALFSIDPNTGVLTFDAAPDFEAPADAGGDNVYDVQVTVTDSGGLTDVQDLQVTVTDENEAPTITSSATPSAPEEQTSATDVESTDPDGDAEGAGLTYAITGGADQAQFSIDPNTGVLTFNAAPDFETPGDANGDNVYEVQVTVTDSGGLTDVQDLQVTVTAGDEAPTITSSATPSAAENQTTATDVDATDPDGDVEGSGLVYSITGGADQALFSIDPNTGVLTFNAAPDFEAPADAGADNVYDVQVTVTDSAGLTDVQDLQVTVTDENEAPTITSGATPSAAENQTAATDVDATDPEGDTEGSGLTYAITGGADAALFSIDPNTGVLTFNAAPDFENPADADTDNVYEVQVTVTDSGGLTDVQDLQVTVTDENEAPTITSGATPSAAENQTTATDVQSSDDQDAEGSGLTYAITGGADAALFTIDPNTGVLTFNAAPDFESPADAGGDNVYDVQVTVTDSGSLTDVQDIAVTVTDENETPTITSGATPSAAENQTIATDVDSTDPEDAEGSGLVYSITGGADAALFSIDPSTGVLTFNMAPDFEAPGDAGGDNVYDVQVTVTDSGTLTDVQDLQVTVTDGNDAPTITSGATPSAPENQTAATDVQSTDDNDAEGSGLTYSVTGGADAALFSIDPNTGVLTFNAAPDFENPADAGGDNVYDVQVTVTDSGTLTDVQDLQVTVTDVNDPPTISMIADQMIDEDTATGPLPFNVDDQETAPGALIVTASSSNQTIIPDGNLTLGGAGMNRTIDVLPAMNQNGGPVTITVTVDDGTAMTSEMFDVTVNPVNDPPVGMADSFDFVGNTQLRVDLAALPAVPSVDVSTAGGMTPTADGVLDNDADPVEMSALSVVGVRDGTTDCADATPPFTDCPTANGGRVTMEGNGQFLYTPLPGDAAASDSFEYRLSDGTDNVIVGVTLNRSARVWYVENDHPGLDEGTSTDPFTTLGAAETASVAGDVIFVHEGDGTSMGHDAGIRLKPGQTLLGEGIDLVLDLALNGAPAPATLFDSVANNHPAVEHTAGDGVTVLADLADHLGVTIRGLLLSGTGNAIDVTALAATPHSVEVTIADNFIVDSGSAAIDLNPNSTGTFEATVEDNAFATTSPTGNAIDVVAGAGAGQVELAINDNVDVTSGATAINVDGSAPGSGPLFITGFSGNSVHGNTGGVGIRVVGAIFDADPTDNDFDPVAGGTTTVGTVTPFNPVGTVGVVLGDPGAAATRVSGNLSFARLDVHAGAGTGLSVAGSGVFTAGPPDAGFQLGVTAGEVIATGGPALDLDPATVNATFDSIRSSASPTTGVRLKDIDGSVMIGNVPLSTIDASTGTAFEVDGGNAMVFYGGVINNGSGFDVEVKNRPATASDVTFAGAIGAAGATTGQGISVTNNLSGVVAFDGQVRLNTGASDAVSLTSNNNTNFLTRFTGGLEIDTTTGVGFRATGGGRFDVLSGGPIMTTIDVTGGGGAVNGVMLDGVTIDLGDATFDTINVAGVAGDAISIANVSNAGIFNGGTTVLNGAGGNGVEVSGSTSADVSFSSLQIDGASGSGILFSPTTGSLTVTGATNIGATTGSGLEDIRILPGTGSVTFGTVNVDNRSNHGILIAAANRTIQFGATTVDNQLNNANAAVEISGTTGGSVTFSSLAIDNNGAGATGVDVITNNVATVDIQGGSITGAGGTAFRVDTGAAAVTYSGTITNAAGASVAVSNRTGGLVDFAGAIDDDGAGVQLADNGAGTVRFRGGLALDTGASDAFSALNLSATGGLIEVCATADCAGGTAVVNTIGATTPISGVGVDLFDYTIGGNGVTFREINVNGGTSGILLNNTGNTGGGFTITGDGSNARNDSGGTIQNTTSHGIDLTLANDVTLRSLRIDTINTAGTHGISSTGGSDFTFSGLHVEDVNGGLSGVRSSGWRGTNLGGVNRIDNDSLFTTFDPDADAAIDLRNSTANMTSLTINDTNFTNQDFNNGKTVVFIEASGSVNMGTVTVENGCEFSNLRGIAFDASTQGTSTLNTVVQDSVFKDAVTGGLGGINALSASASGSSTHTVTFTNNDFDDVQIASGNAGSLVAAIFDSASMTATISGNEFKDLDADGDVVTNAQAIRVVSEQNSGAAGAVDVTIDGNTLLDVGRQAIFISARSSTPDFDVRIRNNLIGTDDTVIGDADDAPVGFTNRDAISISAEDDANVDALVSGNTIVGNHSSQETLNAFTDRVSVGNTPVLNLTVDASSGSGTAFHNVNGGGSDNVVLETLDAGETLCVNMTGNTVTGVNTIDVTRGGGTLNVTQASEAAMEAANNSANVIPSGSPTFNQPACATPTF